MLEAHDAPVNTDDDFLQPEPIFSLCSLVGDDIGTRWASSQSVKSEGPGSQTLKPERLSISLNAFPIISIEVEIDLAKADDVAGKLSQISEDDPVKARLEDLLSSEDAQEAKFGRTILEKYCDHHTMSLAKSILDSAVSADQGNILCDLLFKTGPLAALPDLKDTELEQLSKRLQTMFEDDKRSSAVYKLGTLLSSDIEADRKLGAQLSKDLISATLATQTLAERILSCPCDQDTAAKLYDLVKTGQSSDASDNLAKAVAKWFSDDATAERALRTVVLTENKQNKTATPEDRALLQLLQDGQTETVGSLLDMPSGDRDALLKLATTKSGTQPDIQRLNKLMDLAQDESGGIRILMRESIKKMREANVPESPENFGSIVDSRRNSEHEARMLADFIVTEKSFAQKLSGSLSGGELRNFLRIRESDKKLAEQISEFLEKDTASGRLLLRTASLLNPLERTGLANVMRDDKNLPTVIHALDDAHALAGYVQLKQQSTGTGARDPRALKVLTGILCDPKADPEDKIAIKTILKMLEPTGRISTSPDGRRASALTAPSEANNPNADPVLANNLLRILAEEPSEALFIIKTSSESRIHRSLVGLHGQPEYSTLKEMLSQKDARQAIAQAILNSSNRTEDITASLSAVNRVVEEQRERCREKQLPFDTKLASQEIYAVMRDEETATAIANLCRPAFTERKYDGMNAVEATLLSAMTDQANPDAAKAKLTHGDAQSLLCISSRLFIGDSADKSLVAKTLLQLVSEKDGQGLFKTLSSLSSLEAPDQRSLIEICKALRDSEFKELCKRLERGDPDEQKALMAILRSGHGAAEILEMGRAINKAGKAEAQLPQKLENIDAELKRIETKLTAAKKKEEDSKSGPFSKLANDLTALAKPSPSTETLTAQKNALLEERSLLSNQSYKAILGLISNSNTRDGFVALQQLRKTDPEMAASIWSTMGTNPKLATRLLSVCSNPDALRNLTLLLQDKTDPAGKFVRTTLLSDERADISKMRLLTSLNTSSLQDWSKMFRRDKDTAMAVLSLSATTNQLTALTKIAGIPSGPDAIRKLHQSKHEATGALVERLSSSQTDRINADPVAQAFLESPETLLRVLKHVSMERVNNGLMVREANPIPQNNSEWLKALDTLGSNTVAPSKDLDSLAFIAFKYPSVLESINRTDLSTRELSLLHSWLNKTPEPEDVKRVMQLLENNREAGNALLKDLAANSDDKEKNGIGADLLKNIYKDDSGIALATKILLSPQPKLYYELAVKNPLILDQWIAWQGMLKDRYRLDGDRTPLAQLNTLKKLMELYAETPESPSDKLHRTIEEALRRDPKHWDAALAELRKAKKK